MLKALTTGAMLSLTMFTSALADVKLGAILSLTGNASFLGEPAKKTLELYVADLNAKGGVIGNKIEIVVYDDGGDASKARTFATRLADDASITAVLGGSTSGTSLAVAPIFEDAGVPFISLAGAAEITTPVRRWIFKTQQTEQMACGKIFEDLKKRELRTIALISGTDGYGKAMRAECLKLAPQVGITIAKDEVYGASDSDMTPQLANIRSTPGVDAVVTCGIGQGPAILTRNYQQLGIKLPLYQSHGVASKSYISLAGDAAEGVRLPASALLVAEQLPANDPLRDVSIAYKNYFEKNAGQPASTFGGGMHDALFMLVAAIERAKSTDRVKVRDELEKTIGFVGTLGIVNMNAKDHLGLDLSSFRMLKVHNGDWALVD